MSLIRICDYCGQAIEDDEPFVIFKVDGEHSDDRWTSGYVGHYHTDETPPLDRLRGKRGDGRRDCWGRIDDVLQLAHEFAPTLEAIPVASGQSIAQRRRKHRHTETED